ncbi:SDR family NAD(P)-dependent oxidoreductase [Shewanella corallii]|uniref:SDR family NAD(P)-dependent oxidoreductase n=1 Tax=Shewanella corallii TaxID=560080 RepID=A0ABT0NAF7_9GAMM|nr:SDR family NAD(P)-dependent oxidoreductase [Shewanella corallii]MCL2915393.1 SDR family NAD(P)-dependent oxidoreductase [Shewanella corallii]
MNWQKAKHNSPLMLIAGYGEGLGVALRQKFEQAGYRVIGLARKGGDIQVDLTDGKAVTDVLQTLIQEQGVPDVVITNTARFQHGPLNGVSEQEFEQVWRTGVMSSFHLARQLLPMMAERGHGCFIATGATASVKGGGAFSAFASAKFALRGLVQSLAREFGPKGVHVAHLVVDGMLWSDASRRRFPALTQDKAISVGEAAEVYLQLTRQPRTAWTQELDIRPFNERY